MQKSKKFIGFKVPVEIDKIIEDFKWDMKRTRSEVLADVMNFIKENPDVYQKIKNKKGA